MSFTRGGPNKRKQFEWHYDPETHQLIIINQYGREFMYSLEQIQRVLFEHPQANSSGYFPLSNNPRLLRNGKENPGFSKTLLNLFPYDTDRVQGACYLCVVLEEAGYFQWNGKTVGIGWRSIFFDYSTSTLSARLS